ncbi:MAG: class I SAM-dependent RNA methyltransferase [Clostridiales bacterium]|nr:class I SAM-dependent RNA methyltransferase [Clostridiales bacterium]
MKLLNEIGEIMLEMCTPCLFGLESIVGDELKRLNMQNVRVENGRVLFFGKEEDIARANIRLRTAERVLLKIGEFKASTFNELFEGTKALSWENYIPKDGAFPVKGHSLNSKLESIPDCQSIIKKAVVERLKSKYGIQWFEETGAKYQIQFSVMKDVATLYLDTSGAGLHKRGYRAIGNEAPLRETLAAAMVHLSRYRGKDEFCDPFCGSGTIAIEAALIALNRAPGLNRKFDAMSWDFLKDTFWKSAIEEAKSLEYTGQYRIWGGDINQNSVEIAKNNAIKAGVDKLIRFEKADALLFRRETTEGLIVTNPPYGERMLEKSEAEKLYHDFGAVTNRLDRWKIYLISSHDEFERVFGRKAVKKRKLYNGMIKCDLFMYF